MEGLNEVVKECMKNICKYYGKDYTIIIEYILDNN